MTKDSGPAHIADRTLEQAGHAPEDSFPLLDAALAAAALDRDAAALARYTHHGEDLVRLTRARAAVPETPGHMAAALAATIGGEFGYEGDQATYDAPENADLMQVIDRRKGLPVALGILYLHVARALDWPVYGLNLPGHFVLAAGAAEAPVIFDPFHKGRELSPEDVAALLTQANQAPEDGGTFRLSAMTDRDVLVRLLNNQRVRAAQAGDAQRTAEILRRMVLILPQAAPLWSDYGQAAQAAGNMKAAIAAFQQVIALVPGTDLAAQAEALLGTSRKTLN